MRGLFLLPRLPWPTHDGQAVIAHHVLRGLAERAHHLHVAVLERPMREQLEAWPLRGRVTVETLAPEDDAAALSPRQRRWLNYWGLPTALPAAVRHLVNRVQPDYIEAYGVSVLPLLGDAHTTAPTIWVAADDRCLHELTQLRARRSIAGLTRTLRDAVAMAAYERSFRDAVDAVIAVSDADRAALHWIGGFARVETITNGVELPILPSVEPQVQPHTVMFWGNLDFEPNIEAIRWFARHVWPALAAQHNDAMWWIAGSGRGEVVRALTAPLPGVKLLGCVSDLTAVARRASAVVIPMRSGTGVKNKLLEAAAMARPIVASPRATAGLDAAGMDPWITAGGASEWVEAIESLWSHPRAALSLGQRARRWVAGRHDWSHCAAEHERLIASLRLASAGTPAPVPRRVAA